jgi:quaternary ammonium compound-resistance protein SugE
LLFLCYLRRSQPDETRRTGTVKAKTTHPPLSEIRQRDVSEVSVMAWVLLVVAGLLEVGWSVGMKYTDGFTRLVPSVLTGGGIVASMVLLSYAARTLPIGTAYGVWVGIGAAGAAVFGMVVLGEPATAARIFFVCLLLVAVVGLKATSGH